MSRASISVARISQSSASISPRMHLHHRAALRSRPHRPLHHRSLRTTCSSSVSRPVLSAQVEDIHSLLGLDRSAKPEEVKVAFRRKARKLHPDVNHDEGATAQFIELKEAYKTWVHMMGVHGGSSPPPGTYQGDKKQHNDRMKQEMVDLFNTYYSEPWM